MMFAIGDEEWPGISKLVEECGELVQVMGKLMAIAGQTDHWSGDLRKMLVEEMGDVAAALIFVRDNCLTKAEVKRLAKRADDKAKRFQDWHINHTPQKRVLKKSSKARRNASNA
jgi:NTP pyrophosphatase (non-canonical NTP hydrolase)